MGNKILTPVGTRYARLVVLAEAGSHPKNNESLVLCRCDCGKELVMRAYQLRKGFAKSCGCLRSDNMRALFTTHGKAETREFNVWMAMLGRCENPKNAAYKNYGGRGIKVCKRWQQFENFLTDMGVAPEGKSIDRYPDINGDYEPTNCRWATAAEQSRGRRNTVLITLDGETKPLGEWAEKLHLKAATIWARLNRGWSDDRALGPLERQSRR